MTRRPLAAVCVLALAVLPSCATTPDTQVTGPPRVERAADVVRPDYTPAPTTTTTQPTTTTTHYHPPTTTTTVAEVVPMTAAPAVASGGRLGDPYYEPTWYALRECEAPDWAGGWAANTGNGYYGGLQFAIGSWRAVGGTGYPHKHSPAEQIRRGQMLWEMQGWGAWPSCSRQLGWR